MEQFNVRDEMKVEINYSYKYFPSSVHTLQPLLFHDGKSYRCVLDPDRPESIFGFGETAETALFNWDKHLQECTMEQLQSKEMVRNPEENFKVSVNKAG